jgi:hypothetical protein
VLHWLDALAVGGPVLYGEGAVAHAGLIVARGGDPYGPEDPGTFVAANYPPLSFAVAALGAGVGPFVALRAASILATLALATLVAARARDSLTVAVALGASFLALFPVQIWGAAHKPDPLAVALTAAAVVGAGPSWRRALAAGTCGALAILAKPSAALPLAAVLAFLLWREPRTGRRVLIAGLGAALALGAVVFARFDPAGLVEHVVRRNALAYEPGRAVELAIVAVLSMGALALVAGASRDGRSVAYVAGAVAILVLGGREGATINYLLDLGVALSLAVAPLVRPDRLVAPLLIAGQLVLAVALFRPFMAGATTGAWSDPVRAALAADLARTAPHLAEDSGILVANRIDPVVDDLFLWARLVAAGAIPDEITPRARNGGFATVISAVRLEELARAPAFERQRWPEALARAILAAYRLDAPAIPGHYRYVPRQVIAFDETR